MPTQFYEDFFNRPFPVTHLMLEHVKQVLSDVPQDAELYTAALKAVIEGTRGGEASQEDIQYLFDVLSRVGEEADKTKESKEAEKTKKKKGFGSAYLEWVEQHDGEAACWYAAGGDPERARRLYCETDFRTVEACVRSVFERDWHLSVMRYEAAALAMGGEEKDVPEGDTIDIRDGIDIKKLNASISM